MLVICRFLMGEPWLEVLRGVTTPENKENQVQNGFRERVGNAMQGDAIKEYQYELTAVNLCKKLEFE